MAERLAVRHALLELGEALGLPELHIAPGVSIGAGEDAWRRFAGGASMSLIGVALEVAQQTKENPF